MSSSTVYPLTSHRFYCPVWFHILPEALSKNQWGKDFLYRLPSYVSPILFFVVLVFVLLAAFDDFGFLHLFFFLEHLFLFLFDLSD